ncbi:MAG TPA: acyl-CoA thioester hydrolase/BAAT C-terminal domain-containing protein [Hyphomonadaceae bacterium]|nr:acyl-CoA thioester hydrolase/BAAT C-terminal domain-containing protein [Hyphomonadaceae bacterium]
MKLTSLARRAALAIILIAGGCASTPVAPQTPIVQPASPAAVVETAVAGFPHAKVYRTAGSDARPVLVILGGAEGNDEAARHFGPIFARLGYTAVGFPYYSPNWGPTAAPPQLPDIPGSFIDIRLERIAELRDVVKTIPGADVSRFGIFARSKGSEFALNAASRFSFITSVVAYTPSDLVWEGFGLEMVDHEGQRSSFSYQGQPLPFMPYRGFVEGLLAGPKADLRAIHENGRADHPEKEAAARIPVERYKGPLMIVTGERDAQWNSARMARNIIASRKAAGLETEALIYPEAGHSLAGGDGIRAPDPRSGGTPEADAAARQDSWPKVLAFLSRTLKPAKV